MKYVLRLTNDPSSIKSFIPTLLKVFVLNNVVSNGNTAVNWRTADNKGNSGS